MREALKTVCVLIGAGVFATCASVEPAAAETAIRGARAKAARSAAHAQQNSGYYVPYVTGPGGEQIPVMNVPGSVSVIPRQLMDDQGTTTVCGALRNVAGVTCR